MKRNHRRHARFKARVTAWATRLRVQPTQVRLQQMSRKWASCSTIGWVTFATDLVRQPHGFQDFVIVHELLHLRVPNHGRLFKALLSVHVPRWREYAERMSRRE
jgi:predicted metal-dependent hydrolase